MSDFESLGKEYFREFKQKTALELSKIDVQSYNLKQIDNRLNIYTIDVISNPEKHNLYELLSVKRFFHFLDKYIFKKSEVEAFIHLYELLKFSGITCRRRYKMTPIQVFQFANILGFYKTKEKRLCREALLFVPRKFSKTTSVASLAINDLLFGDANAQSYVAANSYDQAKICFDEIKEILKSLDRRLRHFKLNREVVFNKMRGKTSFIRCLASSPDKLDGLNASVVIVDEYSQADSASLKNVLTSSMGIRVNPLTVMITTASEKLESPFRDTLKSYKKILRGEMENDSVFAHIFEPDVDDEEDSPETWKKVQPHLGITVQDDYYELEYKKAQQSADDMVTFRTKLLNIFVQNTSKTWIAPADIEAKFKQINLANLIGRPPTMVSVDLSVRDDFSAATYMIYFENISTFHSVTDYYFPEGALSGHPNEELYKKWTKDGHLRILPGSVIDYRAIVSDILKRNEYLGILAIGYDPYRSIEFINMLSAAGAAKVITPVKQTYATFTSPIESFEITMAMEKITFDPNPITAYCFGNALMDEDKNENRKPIKRSQNEKIDGVITNLMDFWLFNNVERS